MIWNEDRKTWNWAKNLQERIRAQEPYSKKNTLEICNPPFDAQRSNNVLLDILWFFEKNLRIELREMRIKACHILLGTGNDFVLPPVIVKFIYFDDKNNVYKSRKSLKKMKNKINDWNIYINEHLPKVDAELKNEAQKQSFITSTNNCKVSVLVSKANNTIVYRRINYTSDLANVPNAIKRRDASDKRKLEKDNNGKSICSPGMKRVNQQ